MTRVPPSFGLSLNSVPALCIALLSVIAALPVPARSRSSANAATAVAGVYRVGGTVVNSVTGEPVRGATVAVLTLEDSSRIGAAQSGNDGRFSIGGLAAGKYQLTASKRGYSTAFYDEHELFSSAVVTGAGED